MTKQRIQIIAAFSAFTWGLAAFATPAKEDSSPSTSSLSQSAGAGRANSTSSSETAQIRLATKEVEDQSVSALKGKKVTGADKAELGKIEDFVIDTQSGKIVYAVVSSGGKLGLGDDLRLLQQSSLQASTTGEEFTADVDKSAFEAMPVISKDDLKADRIARVGQKNQTSRPTRSTASAGTDPEAMTQPVTVTASESTGDAPATASKTEDETATHLVLASELKGKEVHANGKEAGKIDGIALHAQQGTAAALFKPEEDFAGTKATFEVPFDRLQFRSGENQTVATTLNRSDFANVQSSATGAETAIASNSSSAPSPADRSSTTAATAESDATIARSTGATDLIVASNDTRTSTALEQPSTTADPSRAAATIGEPATNDNTSATVAANNTPDQALTPTGRGDTDANAAIAAATTAIRSALSNDAALSDKQIEVSQSGQKIILAGEVENDAAKQRVESIAKVAAGDAEIENKIKVNEK